MDNNAQLLGSVVINIENALRKMQEKMEAEIEKDEIEKQTSRVQRHQKYGNTIVGW